MATAPLIMLLVLLTAVLVVALFLITVVTMLHIVSNRLNKILGAVGQVVENTDGLAPVVEEIADDIAAGEATIVGAVDRLKQRKGIHDGAEAETVGAAPAYVPPSGFTNY
jgi:uncharacterized protein YkvS